MTTALSQITQTWTNPYNSKMTLTGNGGVLSGQYASTAGASGVYRVYGYIDPQSAAVTPGGAGVPVGLILNWRSIQQGGTPDPSWNYTSGMAGQLICNAAGDTVINLNHALIASNPLPGAIDTPGFYVDRLEYDQATLQEDAGYEEAAPLGEPPADFAAQATLTYVDEQDPNTKLYLAQKPDSPAFWAAFEWSGGGTTLIGTCNTGYLTTLGPYQSLAFCGTILPGSAALSLSGWLDYNSDTITLQEYWSGPQTWPLRFFQTRGRTLTMKAQ